MKGKKRGEEIKRTGRGVPGSKYTSLGKLCIAIDYKATPVKSLWEFIKVGIVLMKTKLDEYSSVGLKELFERELGLLMGRRATERFRCWVMRKGLPKKRQEWPYSYHLWLVERVHEYQKKGKAVGGRK